MPAPHCYAGGGREGAKFRAEARLRLKLTMPGRRRAGPDRLEVRARPRTDRPRLPLRFHFSVLTEFHARLVAGGAEHLLLDTMLERFKERGLVKARGRQRTDSTHVLAAVHDLHLLELVAETLRATLDDLAAVVPDWLRGVARPAWFERYARRIEDWRLPKSQAKREALALEVGADGFLLLDALDGSCAPAEAREVPMVGTLRTVWRVHYARDDGRPHWRAGK